MRAVRWLTALAISIANLAGTVIVFVILVWVIPPDGDDGGSAVTQPDPRRRLRRCCRGPAGHRLGLPAPAAEPPLAARGPRADAGRAAQPPAGAADGLLRRRHRSGCSPPSSSAPSTATYSFELGRRVAITVVLAGLATCQIAYLLTEWLLRPVGRAGPRGAPARGPGAARRHGPDPLHLGSRLGGADARPRVHRALRARRRGPYAATSSRSRCWRSRAPACWSGC